MFKRILCALLCLILAGSVFPASVRAAAPEVTYDVYVESPADCFFSSNINQVEAGHFRAAAGKEAIIQIYFRDPLLELDHWESVGLELNEEQSTNITLRFVMPANDVRLYPRTRESVCPFTDVSRDSWYYRGVMDAYKGSCMYGTSPTTFGPDEFADRAQTVAILKRLVAGAGGGGEDLHFEDVPEDRWFYKDVYWAVSAGVTYGISSTEFAPYQPVTRAQFISMFYRAHRWIDGCEGPRPDVMFTDVPQNAYYREALSWALGQGLIFGRSQTIFDPNAPCTRAEIAATLSRI